MESPNDATLAQEAKLSELEGDINKVVGEIAKVVSKLDTLEENPLK
jgi:hypothetical protein